MSVGLINRVVIVRDARPHPAWAVVYLLVGLGLIWASLAGADPTDKASTYVGSAFGLAFAAWGAAWLLPARVILRFDPAARDVRAFAYGWFGRLGVPRVDSAAYADVASVGRDTFKDPRNNAVWAIESVVRLKDGRRFPAGPRDDADKIGALSGLPVEHRLVWQEQPPEPSGA